MFDFEILLRLSMLRGIAINYCVFTLSLV